MDLLHIYIEYTDIVPINCENLKQIHVGKALKEIHLCVLLFDVGGPRDIMNADVICHGWEGLNLVDLNCLISCI